MSPKSVLFLIIFSRVDIVTLLTVFNEMNDLPFLPQLIPFVMVLSTQFSTEEIYYVIFILYVDIDHFQAFGILPIFHRRSYPYETNSHM